MSEIHPHDALLARLNEEQFSARKQVGMWGGCDWAFIDADPDALVLEVVAKERHEVFAANIGRAIARAYGSQFRTRVVRTWSRRSGSDGEPLLQEFPFVFAEDPTVPRELSADLWERCAEIGWERGEKAKARPEPGAVHRVVNVVSAAPPLPKPYAEMSEADIRSWAHAWATRIVGSFEEQQGGPR